MNRRAFMCGAFGHVRSPPRAKCIGLICLSQTTQTSPPPIFPHIRVAGWRGKVPASIFSRILHRMPALSDGAPLPRKHARPNDYSPPRGSLGYVYVGGAESEAHALICRLGLFQLP